MNSTSPSNHDDAASPVIGLGCDGDCSHCASKADHAPDPGATGPYRGWSLVAASSMYFLMPLPAACVGALVGGGSAWSQWLGGSVGLIAGLVIAAVLGKIFSGRQEQISHE